MILERISVPRLQQVDVSHPTHSDLWYPNVNLTDICRTWTPRLEGLEDSDLQVVSVPLARSKRPRMALHRLQVLSPPARKRNRFPTYSWTKTCPEHPVHKAYRKKNQCKTSRFARFLIWLYRTAHDPSNPHQDPSHHLGRTCSWHVP